MTRPAHSRTFGRLAAILGACAFGFVTLVMVVSPFGFLVVLGLIGGSGMALSLLLRRRFGSHPPPPSAEVFPGEHLPSDVINVSRIRVAGFGGLGMVIIAVVIALVLPRVGMVMAAGLIGGTIAALAVILYRRREGPMTSSDRGLPGARTMLVDRPPDREGSGLQSDRRDDDSRRPRELSVVPDVVAKTT